MSPPNPARSRLLYGGNVRANGIRQHFLRYGGTGFPLVIVPGITSPAVTWGFVAERFAAAFDVHVLDVRGRGLSETGPGLDYGLDVCAADVAEFAAALGFERYHLVGHSMGARIGIRVARHKDPRLDRLVLLDPPVTGPGRRPYPVPLSWYIDSIRLAQRGAGLDELRTFTPTWSDAHVRLRAEWLHSCDETAITRTYEGFHSDDIHADLPSIAVPTLLVVAEKGVIRPEDVEEIRRLAPGIESVWVPNAGNMIPWDQYDGMFDAIGDFLGPIREPKPHSAGAELSVVRRGPQASATCTGVFRPLAMAVRTAMIVNVNLCVSQAQFQRTLRAPSRALAASRGVSLLLPKMSRPFPASKGA